LLEQFNNYKTLEENMLEEKLLKKLKTINENFINLGFDLEEDLVELVTQREDIKDRIENTKYKKMTFSKDEETILIVFLILSFINEHFNVEKFPSKTKMITAIVILLIVNLIYFLDDYHQEDIIISLNLVILGIDFLFILTNFFLLIFKRKGFYFIFFLLGLLFLILPFFTTMMFALRGIPHG